MHTRRRPLVATVSALALLATACGAGGSGGASGEIVWYAGMPEHASSRLAAAFEAETGIEVNVLRQSAGELIARVQSESGRPAADLIGVGTENLEVLVEADLIRPYEGADVSELSEEFVDPRGYWFTESLSALVLGVNELRWEEQFGDRPYPETWDEILDEEFADQIVMPSPVTSGTAYAFVMTQVFRLGEDAAWDYLDRLDPNIAEYTSSGGAPSQLAAAGEHLMAISYSHDLITAKQAGFPLEIIHPEDTGYMVAGIAIVEGGPNPDGAEEFIDWLLGAEAQQLYADLVGGMSARDDVSLPEGSIPLDELSLVDFDAVEAASKRDEILDEFVERYDP